MHVCLIILMIISAIACMTISEDANSLWTIAWAIMLSTILVVEFVLRR